MFKINDVCAVVVSFNGGKTLLQNVHQVAKQVSKVIIIDNASDNDTKEILKIIEKDNIEIIYNVSNKGLAVALNQGLRYAKDHNYKLMLTMDQDSYLKDNAVRGMLLELNEDKKIVSIGAAYPSCFRKRGTEATYLITSGNLVLVEKALQIGGYCEEYFIDDIDIDFSLALKDSGGKLKLSSIAKMEHQIGESEEIKTLLGKNKQILSHSPLRYYYMYRNHILFIKKFCSRHPLFCLKKSIVLLRDFLNLLCFEKKKKEKQKMIIRGVIDGFRGKSGPICLEVR